MSWGTPLGEGGRGAGNCRGGPSHFGPLVTCGGLKYTPEGSIRYTIGSRITRSANGSSGCWLGHSVPRIYRSIQDVANRAGIRKVRTKAFFTEKKREHGQELCAQVFEKWLNQQWKLSATFDNVDLPLAESYNTEGLARTKELKGITEGIAERTLDAYAFQHLVFAYPRVWEAWGAVTSAVNQYSTYAGALFPIIKEHLQKEMHIRCPELRWTVADDAKACYNLDLLFFKLLENALVRGNLPSLQYELRGEMSERADRWELRINVPHGLEGSLDTLLLRTHDRNDLTSLRESATATWSAWSDIHKEGSFHTLSEFLQKVDSNLEELKKGVRDLMNQVKLGAVIHGTCVICESWETLA